ncbi:hypothetical protein K523DRAFT_416469 [Schizophyllum commune Tattone D]|nr:hypothetical protein K523DRAFT_416469 [Schizophyllum commune Tattone D]
MSSGDPISRPSDGDSPQSERSDQSLEKRVTSTSDTRVESSLATADACKSNKRNPAHSRRHLVYAIKLTEEGFRAWSAAHLSPPPADLEGEALERWKACKGMMASLIPWRCSDDFDLPVVNGEYCTRVWEGGERDKSVLVVALADNRARARRHRRPPPDEVVAQMAEAIFQPGAVPGWYRVAP